MLPTSPGSRLYTLNLPHLVDCLVRGDAVVSLSSTKDVDTTYTIFTNTEVPEVVREISPD